MPVQKGFEGQSHFFTHLWKGANIAHGRLALPESRDPRIIEAAHFLLSEHKLRELWLFSEKESTLHQAKQQGVDLEEFHSKIVWTRERLGPLIETTRNQIVKRQIEKGTNLAAAILDERSKSPLFQAGCLLENSAVDAIVAGSQTATSNVLRAVLGTIGLKANSKVLSGAMLMELSAKNELKLYADMAVIPEPHQDQIIDIALSSVATWRALLPDEPPRVAFLSFSTMGSATSPSSQKMRGAAAAFKERHPEIISEGELQFDAAVSEEVSKRKVSGSSLNGQANIFIFPNLDAGNISYKITERLAGYHAIGSILQGSAKPFFDLSRGANVEDIVKTSILALSLAEGVT